MNENTNKTSKAVKGCAECSICTYTRDCKKRNVRYYMYRLVERICPNCRAVNKELKKDFQKSSHF